VIDVMLTAVGWLFATVTALTALLVATAWFPNASVAGVTFTGTTPLPVSDTVCGLLLALSVILRVPVRDPVVVGVKVTLMVQLVAAASDVPQLSLSA
jgi:hypothetical protein